jgi:hypothetical protein
MSKFSKLDKFVLIGIMPLGVYVQVFELVTEVGSHGIIPWGVFTALVGLCYLLITWAEEWD